MFNCQLTRGECRRLIRPAPGEVDLQKQQQENTTMVSLVNLFLNPDTSSSDWNYRMPGRGTIVRNAKSLRVRIRVRIRAENCSKNPSRVT